MSVWELTAHELSKLLNAGQISATELVQEMYKRIEEIDGEINAYITLCKEEALRQAGEVDEARKRGETLHPLAGIPIAIKDNICVRNYQTSCGSKILAGFKPPYDATVVERVKNAGMVILGKTNMDEFAMGSSNETSYYGIVRNPWNKEKIPGGSSGGSAAAVAAGEAILALGSDTGGSIRQPASLCGVVGLKPTYGRVSRYGLVAFASSLDQIGPITKDVEDAALLLQVIAGWDEHDSTSVPQEVPDYIELIKRDIKGLKIGLPYEYFGEGLDEEVREALEEAVRLLEGMGAEVVWVHLPHTEYAIACYYIICTAEASSNLARYDGVQYGYRAKSDDMIQMYKRTRAEGFGAEVKRRIMLGTYVLSAGYYEAYYLKGMKVRTLIKEDFDKAFREVDCIITPTSPTPAFGIGEKLDDPLKMYLSDIYTISANLAGIPAVSIPCGFSKDGLPIGMQIMGKPFDEVTILQVGYAYQQETNFHKCMPELALAGEEDG